MVKRCIGKLSMPHRSIAVVVTRPSRLRPREPTPRGHSQRASGHQPGDGGPSIRSPFNTSSEKLANQQVQYDLWHVENLVRRLIPRGRQWGLGPSPGRCPAAAEARAGSLWPLQQARRNFFERPGCSSFRLRRTSGRLPRAAGVALEPLDRSGQVLDGRRLTASLEGMTACVSGRFRSAWQHGHFTSNYAFSFGHRGHL